VPAAQLQRTPLGRISISAHAIAQIAERSLGECYGVVGLGPRSWTRRAVPFGRPRAIEVEQGADGLELALRVVIAYGLNLAEVAATVRSRVTYEVERLTGLEVAAVEVRVDDVRASG
jgi:uncharacterized alkaline shock family protein YloU